MSIYTAMKRRIDNRTRAVEDSLMDFLLGHRGVAVVKAPPGSGKTHLLIEAVARAHARDLRIAVACQTNSQADDVCRRIVAAHPLLRVVRFVSSKAEPLALGRAVTTCRAASELPYGACIVVGTTAKWGLVNIDHAFDVLMVDEAWQMAWKDFMLLGQVAPKFILIGDPGQIPPVVTIEVKRWETSPRPPHRPAPDVILSEAELNPVVLELPATRRLPFDSATLVQPFYDFSFECYAGPGERTVHVKTPGQTGVHRAFNALAESSAVGVTIPTPDGGPPLERDDELARTVVQIVEEIVGRGAEFQENGARVPIEPEHIGIVATHRVMNSAIDLALPTKLRGRVVVDTPERWQGLECPIMIAVHPLSGLLAPSAFDLETGRMCVMISRHRGGLILVGRDHISETLASYMPSATQSIGRPDVTGRGHDVHLGLWETLERRGHLFGV